MHFVERGPNPEPHPLIKKARTRRAFLINGGGAGIRTLGTSRYAGFQDRCFRPLSHPSKEVGHYSDATLPSKRLMAQKLHKDI